MLGIAKTNSDICYTTKSNVALLKTIEMEDKFLVEYYTKGRKEYMYIVSMGDYTLGKARVINSSKKVKLDLLPCFRLKGLENKVKKAVREFHLHVISRRF